MAEHEGDDDLPSGYREAARPGGPELIDYAQIIDEQAEPREGGDAGDEDSATVRLTNALILNALHKRAVLMRLEPTNSAGRVVAFKIGGEWRDEVDLPAEFAGDVGRRFKLMASVPLHQGDAAMGHILIRMGSDPPTDVQLRLLVRPASVGERLLIRVVPDAERERLLWRLHEGSEAAEQKLRWEHEQAFRVARTASPEAAATAARSLLASAEALLPGAYRFVLEAHMLLSEIAEQRGAYDQAVDEVRTAIDIGKSLGAPSMSTAALHEQLADLLEERGEHSPAIDARRKAAELVERALGKDDPCIAGVLGRLAGTLARDGQREEASTAYDSAIGILSELTGDDDLELRDLVSARHS